MSSANLEVEKIGLLKKDFFSKIQNEKQKQEKYLGKHSLPAPHPQWAYIMW